MAKKYMIEYRDGEFVVTFHDRVVYAKEDQELLDIIGAPDYNAFIAALKLFEETCNVT